MSRFTGNLGREEEDGLGWDGLVESGRERRECEAYDGLVRDATLWRKQQIAAPDTRKIVEETLDRHAIIFWPDQWRCRQGGCWEIDIFVNDQETCRKSYNAHLADALCAALEEK